MNENIHNLNLNKQTNAQDTLLPVKDILSIDFITLYNIQFVNLIILYNFVCL